MRQSRPNEIIGVGMFGVELVHDPAVADNQDAVAEGQELLGFAGDDQHSLAAGGDPLDDLVDVGSGTNSMPLVGSSRTTSSGSVSIHLATTTFCWFPPLRVRV